MMKMTAKRVLFFLLFIFLIGMLMYQNWQSKPASEKWLYFFGVEARDYAGKVLGTGRGTDVPVPEELGGSEVVVHDGFVTFSSRQGPDLILAFSPAGAPPEEGFGGRPWSALGDGWYLLK